MKAIGFTALLTALVVHSSAQVPDAPSPAPASRTPSTAPPMTTRVSAGERSGIITDPTGRQWKISIAPTPNGETISVTRLNDGSSPVWAVVGPASRQELVNALDVAIAASKDATFRKTPGPARRPSPGRSGVALEIDAAQQHRITIGGRGHSLEDTIVLREVLARLADYAARIR